MKKVEKRNKSRWRGEGGREEEGTQVKENNGALAFTKSNVHQLWSIWRISKGMKIKLKAPTSPTSNGNDH